MPETNSTLGLRVGDWVQVKSAEEILKTLDDNQAVEHLPFMPEMLQHCGKRFRVSASAHKTADTIELFSIRRMSDTVHLEDLRCDGFAHGGCQAGCLFYWKESWLKRVAPDRDTSQNACQHSRPAAMPQDASAMEFLMRGAKRPSNDGTPPCFRCQATEMLKATTEVRRRDRFDPRFYVKDLTSGNVSLFDFIRFGALAALNAFLSQWFGWRYPRLHGLAGDKTPSLKLNLESGELVYVRSKQEIQQTLNRQLRNRGLNFDHEMVPYCEKGPFRVLRSVRRLINEKTGALVEMKNPCVILENVTCSGNYLHERMFSRRREYMFFREIWLKRANPVQQEIPRDSASPSTVSGNHPSFSS